MTEDFTDVPDSTDWLSTPLAALTPVEAALRCQVCKDFYKTPMLTSCSHTFCSLCIRHALSNDGRCPLCRNTDQELKLRNNWALDEIVDAFQKARAKTLEFARKPPARTRASSPKRKREEEATAPEPKRLRSSARLSSARSQESPAPSHEVHQIPDSEDDEIDDKDDNYEPEDGLVPCPMCQTRMKEEQVFAHLDKCPGPSEAGSARPSRESSHGTPKAQSNLPYDQQGRQSGAKALDRLPALNYSILKDQAMRKKMVDLGLSTGGSRQMLEKRHKEWITIWNANCDSLRPKRRSELMHDLEVWERIQGGRTPGFGKGRAGAMATAVKDKDFDGAAWATKHDTSFKDLIANARKSRTQAQAKKEPDAIGGKSDDDDQAAAGPDVQETSAGMLSDSAPQSVVDSEVVMTELPVVDGDIGVPNTDFEAEEVNQATTVAEPSSVPSKPSNTHLMQDGFEETPPSLGVRTRSSQDA
ncbi:hypothetical protein ACHAQH_008267 [Verticillium albo-atrum]